MKCSSCGNENVAVAEFCANCGRAIAGETLGVLAHSASPLELEPPPRTFLERLRYNRRWGIAVLLMLATTVNYLDRQTLAVAGPTIKKEFSLNNEQFSYIVNGFLLAYGIMHPVSGRIIDWLGTRVGLGLAIIWWSVANMAIGLTRGLWSMTAVRFLLGVGEAGNFPGAIKSVSEWFPAKERSMATGILNVGAGAGAMIAPPLVGYLIWRFNWQTAFVVTGAIGLLWGVLWLFLYYHPDHHPRLTRREREHIRGGQAPEPETDRGNSALKQALSRRELWVLMLARFISDPGWYFYLVWLPSYLSDVRGFSLTRIALFAWVPYLAADFGSLIGGAVSSYFGRRGMSVINARKLAMCLFAAMMPVAIPAVRSESPYYAILFISIATTAHQAWAASLLTLPADLFPRRAVASAYGLTGGCGILGSVVFTHLVGWIVDHAGYVPVFSIVGFLHPVAAIIVVLFVRSRLIEMRNTPAGGLEAIPRQERGP